jgi:hypothetical protein
MVRYRFKHREVLFFVVITISIVLAASRMYQHYKRKGVPVANSQLDSILVPGRYTGVADYSPSKVYPNGLTCELNANIVKEGNTTKVEIKTRAYDKITNELKYEGVRYEKYSYKPNHGKIVFRNSKSYINQDMVSSSHGRVTKIQSNNMTILSNGSWHISDRHHEITSVITTTDKGMSINYFNDGLLPFIPHLTMTETYTRL